MSKDTQQQKQYKILLIGEVCLDIYNMGIVSRISPEAPVPVLKKQSSESKVGMAGNVKKNIESMLPNASIDFFSNPIDKIEKIRFIDRNSNYQIMRYDVEEKLEPACINDITSAHSGYDAIVLSDYDKGLISESFISSLISRFPTTKIFVDSKKKDLSPFVGCLIKINEKESSSITDENKKDLDIIVTKGPLGCEYNGEIYHTKSVEVYDVCGAGDVFLSSLVVRWLETSDIDLAIKTANNCASLSVTKMGCYTIKREEYETIRV